MHRSLQFAFAPALLWLLACGGSPDRSPASPASSPGSPGAGGRWVTDTNAPAPGTGDPITTPGSTNPADNTTSRLQHDPHGELDAARSVISAPGTASDRSPIDAQRQTQIGVDDGNCPGLVTGTCDETVLRFPSQ